jgi:hypothetical protein
MKKLVMSATLATILASPAFAQADANMFPKDVTASISTPAPRAARHTSATAQRDSLGAYGRAGGVATFYGDPDPNIQFQLNRESEEGVW